jgi:hypothetical protein
MRLTTATRKDTGVYPGDDVVGRERETWYDVSRVAVTSGGIDVADLGAFPAESLCLRVPKGEYAVEARLIDFAGSLCLSRVRVRPVDAAVSLGPKLGAIPVDFAAVAIGDFGAICSQLDEDEQEELNEDSGDFMQVDFCEPCRVKVGDKSIRFVVCKAGFGDGRYPVYRLKRRGKTVGFEVEFIRDGHVLTRP